MFTMNAEINCKLVLNQFQEQERERERNKKFGTESTLL